MGVMGAMIIKDMKIVNVKKGGKLKYIILVLSSICFIMLAGNFAMDIYKINKMQKDFTVCGEKMKIVADHLLNEEYPVIIINEEYTLSSDSDKTINAEETKTVTQMTQWKDISGMGYYEIIKDNGGVYFIKNKGIFGIYGIMYFPNGFDPEYDTTIKKKKELQDNWYCFVSQ